MRLKIVSAICVLAAMSASLQRASADEDLSIVINPRTGDAAIRNDSDASIDLDGYLLRSSGNVFDEDAWLSLEEQSIPGWVDGPAAPNRLGDTNLFGSSSLAPGAIFDLGSPYVPFAPGAIGEVEPGLDFTYNVPGVGSFAGDVEFSIQNNVVLVIDTASGEATLENQSAFDVDIDGYLIRSSESVLDADGWAPLQATTAGWAAATGADNRLAEGNLLGSTFLAADGGSLSIGAAIDAVALNDETDLSLEFSVPGVGTIQGGVLFVGGVAVEGDANGDGAVDLLDLDILGSNFGLTPATVAEGDFNGDNVVDLLDLDILGSNFGAGTATVSAVPEPTSLGGLALCLLAAASSIGSRRG